MEQDIIILSASNWNMADETTGEVRKGTTLWYVYDRGQRINPDGSCGDTPAKVTMPFEYLNTICQQGGAPVHARALFELRTRGNKPVLEIVDIRYDRNGKKDA